MLTFEGGPDGFAEKALRLVVAWWQNPSGGGDGVVEGRFPRRALKAVMEWHELHRDDLLQDWLLAEQHQPLNKIPPLE